MMTYRKRVLLLTEPDLPELGPDDASLFDAIRRHGGEPVPVVWSGEIPRGDLAVIRSTWDYTDRVGEFLDAVDRIGQAMPLWNPADTVRWNTDKSYLLELADAGAPVPPALILGGNEDLDIAEVAGRLDAVELVVKPLIGAGGYDTVRIRTGAGTIRSVSAVSGDIIVQRFVPEIATAGEWSLIFFGDSFSHAVLKRPGGGEFRVQERHGGDVVPAAAPVDLLKAAERVLAMVKHPWLYARVDGTWADGRFQLMELELIEPELFFRFSPDAADRFAAMIVSS